MIFLRNKKVAAATAPAQMSAPSLVVDSDTAITATLAADPADGGSPITSYDLRYSTDEATWTEVIGITSPHQITGLTASTLYYVQTRAVNAVGAGAWSASASDTTQAAAGGITDPTDVGAVIWLDGTDWTYQKSLTDGTGDITGTGQAVRYLVDRTANTNDFYLSVNPAALSLTDKLDFNNASFIPKTALSGLTSNMWAYALISTTDTEFCAIGRNGFSTHGIGIAVDGNGSDPHAGFSGTFAYSTNGVDETSPTRDDLNTAWATGSNVVIGMRGFDLTSPADMTTAFQLLAVSAGVFASDADFLHFVLLDGTRPGIATESSDVIDWLKSEGGIA